MPCEIRKATIEDLAYVYRFELSYIREIEPDADEAWKCARSRHQAQWTANLDRMFIATQGEAIIGHCFWQSDEDNAILASLYILPERRRRGCGQQLLQCFEADAHRCGFDRLTLGVYQGNPARELYRNAGYQRTHTKDKYEYYEKRR